MADQAHTLVLIGDRLQYIRCRIAGPVIDKDDLERSGAIHLAQDFLAHGRNILGLVEHRNHDRGAQIRCGPRRPAEVDGGNVAHETALLIRAGVCAALASVSNANARARGTLRTRS